MDSTQRGSNSAVDAKVATVSSDVIFGRGHGDLSRWYFTHEQGALAALSPCNYHDYSEWCAWWFDQQRFAEMAFDGSTLENHN